MKNNTCSGHGQQGLSDTLMFGSLGDRLYVRVAEGGDGVNFEAMRMEWIGNGSLLTMKPLKESGGVVWR